MRIDGRNFDDLRPVILTPGFSDYAEGSVLIEVGKTRVLCNATIDEGVPRWMQAQNRPGGWVTAEYAMLPRATQLRTARETRGLSGRTQEIRRLIGRSLRAALNLEKLGPRTCILDCDVIQADGGTRTAAITGSYIALVLALKKLIDAQIIPEQVINSPVAAVSVGMLDGFPALDLCYAEDSTADVDFNVVMNSEGKFIELQGTAEQEPFTHSQLNELLNLAYKGIGELLKKQQEVLNTDL